MPERSVRFAVRNADGKASDIWKCWTNLGSGKRDVYLTSRPLGQALKLSLHEGGQWHVGFDGRRKDELFLPDEAPPSRFLGKWVHPGASSDPFVLASRVLFPWACATQVHTNIPTHTAWIDCAPERQMVEVTVFLMNVETPPDDWPGKTAMATGLVGRFPLEGGGHVVLVHRCTPMWNDSTPLHGSTNYFRGRTKDDLVQANRMVAWGQQPNGSITFIESRVTVGDSAA